MDLQLKMKIENIHLFPLCPKLFYDYPKEIENMQLQNGKENERGDICKVISSL